MPPADEPLDAELEALLRSARAQPSERFVNSTERRLLGRAPREHRPTRRTILAGAGLSGALAAVALAASIVDSGPLSPDGTDLVHARPRCRQVQVTRIESVGQLVRGANGRPLVIKHRQPVTRTVTRCD